MFMSSCSPAKTLQYIFSLIQELSLRVLEWDIYFRLFGARLMEIRRSLMESTTPSMSCRVGLFVCYYKIIAGQHVIVDILS